MIESALAQALFKLFLGLAGILMGRAALFWMDTNVDKFTWLKDCEDEKAKAIYYAARLIFVALIIASAIS